MFAPGTNIRGYTVERALDAPAGWHELLARDDAGTPVMLRVPPDLDGAERMRGEVSLAKKHRCESLLPSLELVEHNGWPVQMLAYVDGLTLEALEVVVGRLAPEAVCRIGRQIALALVELHERGGVAHGALAADRVLVDVAGNARLVDVGCARPGGPRRMQSPERRKSVGGPSALDDLWALGVLLVDAATGSALDASGDDATPAGPHIDAAQLPDRLADALKTLVAPMGSRLTNASAAVRIFTELEKRLGDGSVALRKAIAEARPSPHAKKDGGPGPITLSDEERRPFAGLMRDAGTDPSDEPITVEQDQTNPSNPRTVEMTPGSVIDVAQMQRMSALAEEAARRTSGPVRAPHVVRTETVDDVSRALPPIGARDIHEEETVSDPRAQAEAVAARALRALPAPVAPAQNPPPREPAPREMPTERVVRRPRDAAVPAAASSPSSSPTSAAPHADDPHTLDDAERAALGMPTTTKVMIAAVGLAFVIGVAVALLR